MQNQNFHAFCWFQSSSISEFSRNTSPASVSVGHSKLCINWIMFDVLNRCFPLTGDLGKHWYVFYHTQTKVKAIQQHIQLFCAQGCEFAQVGFFFVYPDVSAFLQMAPVSVPADDGPQHVQGSVVIPVQAAPKAVPPKVLPGPIPSGHIPKPVILPDYIA